MKKKKFLVDRRKLELGKNGRETLIEEIVEDGKNGGRRNKVL